MSTRILLLSTVAFLSLWLGFATDLVAAESVEAISWRPMTLKEGVTPKVFEEFLKGLPSMEGLIPGVESIILKGDRGVNKGKYIHLFVFDSAKARDFYFPENGESLWDAWMRASDGLPGRLLEQTRQYLKPGNPETYGDVTDYVGIEPVACERLVKIIKKNPMRAAFSCRPITLKQGVTPEAFENFIKSLSSLKGSIPGVEFLFLKGDRGVNKGKYIHLWVYDSVKVRDFYFPENDEDSLWDAWMRASDGAIQKAMEQFSQYVEPTEPGTYGEVTNYVSLPMD